MPTPNANETREEFIDRCMSDNESMTDFPRTDQRYAFCNSVFDRSEEDKNYHDDEEEKYHHEEDEDKDYEDDQYKQPNEKLRKALQKKVDDHNSSVGNTQSKRTSVATLFKVYKRGVGAFRTNPPNNRPNMNEDSWAFARVNSFLYALKNGRFRSGKHDTDLLPSGHPQSSKAKVPGEVDTYTTREEAERRARQLGGSGSHSHTIDGETVYMPFRTHAEYRRALNNRSSNESGYKETFTDYPQSASNNARRAKKWLEENGNPNNCLTNVGRRRMTQLANREPLSRDVVGRMAKFKRHQQHKDVPYDEGCGGIAWDAWGGTSGINWAIRTIERLNKMNKYYNYRNLSTNISIKDVDTQSRTVAGYFSAFNNVDADGDLIKKGAFAKSIKERGPNSSSNRKIAHLAHHDMKRPIGIITHLQEDNKGLYFESKLGTHTDGEDALKMYESGIITEHSIGFQYLEDKTNWIDIDEKHNVEMTQEGQEFIEKRNGYYEISEVKLWEGSYVTFGSNSSTPSFGVIKSLDDKKKFLNKINDRMVLLMKELSNGTYTDNCFQLLIQELAYIQKQYTSLLNFEPVIPTQQTKADIEQEKVREFLLYTLPKFNF